MKTTYTRAPLAAAVLGAIGPFIPELTVGINVISEVIAKATFLAIA